MSIIDGLDKLLTSVEQDNEIFKILKILLDPKDNLEVKTEIKKPFLFSALKTYRDYLAEHKLIKSAEKLTIFMENSFRLLISKDRKSREEIIRAIASNSMHNTEENNIIDKKKGLIPR